jgi:hypothetical protein
MPPDKRLLETLKDRLSRHREINLRVTGQKVRTDHLSTGLVRMGR